MSAPIYAVISDIHSNWQALQAVLKDASARGATHYVCLGDVVGYNANPVECLEKVRELGCVIVSGNHDHYCSFDDDLTGFHPIAADAVDWTRKQLSSEHQVILANLRLVERVENFTIVHSTLDMPEMWGYVFESLEAEASFNYQMTTVCFFGHTHVPLAFVKGGDITGGSYSRLKINLEKKYFINVGSIGQPRDGDPRASYGIYNLETREIELRRVEYDIAAAQAEIRKAGLPERLAARLAIGR
ncbi:MAG: metallophosphoesterase family protein [Kiritimatiellae bacterium]|nr:metallophosphoesterase family protein [Kiritimatiellia bacterium]